MLDGMQDTLRVAHSQPHDASLWFLLSCTALHYAAGTHQAAAYRSAFTLCKRAKHLLQAGAQRQESNSHAGPNDPLSQQQRQKQQQQQQQQQQVQLQCMMSECCLHKRKQSSKEDKKEALSSAKAAVQTASGLHDPELIAAALQQLSR